MIEQGKNSPRWKPTPEEMVLMSIEGISFLAQVALCVLSYNSLGLRWLLYLGWATLAVAMVLGWRARAIFEHGTTLSTLVEFCSGGDRHRSAIQ
jgi:hypothetical protein